MAGQVDNYRLPKTMAKTMTKMIVKSVSSAYMQRLAHLTSTILISARRRVFSSSVFPSSQSSVGRSFDVRMIMPITQNGGNTKTNKQFSFKPYSEQLGGSTH